jgi:hypothetical protein
MALSDGELLDIFGIEMESSIGDASKKKASQAREKQKLVTKAAVQSPAAKSTKKTSQSVVAPAVKKNRGKKEGVVVEAKEPAPRPSTASTKVAARSKAMRESSVRAGKPKTPIPSPTVKVVASMAAKPKAARAKKSVVPSPAKPQSRSRRTK